MMRLEEVYNLEVRVYKEEMSPKRGASPRHFHCHCRKVREPQASLSGLPYCVKSSGTNTTSHIATDLIQLITTDLFKLINH